MEPHTVQSRLKLSVIFTFFIFIIELAGGWIANSLALMSDAAHMFADVFSLSLSWFALKVSERPSTATKTYGYHRFEILAAFLNGLLLIVLAVGIWHEAYQRFHHPHEVQSGIVIGVAILGLLTNLAVISFLKSPFHETNDLNLKSAFYHVLGDSLASVGVIVGGVVMLYTGWYAADALIGAGIGILIVWGAKTLLSDSLHILLEGVPRGVSVQDVERELTAIPAIRNVHELHIWCICSNIYALSAHALVHDQKVNQARFILDEARNMLKAKFNIAHSTIQLESSPCANSHMNCEIKH